MLPWWRRRGEPVGVGAVISQKAPKIHASGNRFSYAWLLFDFIPYDPENVVPELYKTAVLSLAHTLFDASDRSSPIGLSRRPAASGEVERE